MNKGRLARFLLRRLRHRAESDALASAVDAGLLTKSQRKVGGVAITLFAVAAGVAAMPLALLRRKLGLGAMRTEATMADAESEQRGSDTGGSASMPGSSLGQADIDTALRQLAAELRTAEGGNPRGKPRSRSAASDTDSVTDLPGPEGGRTGRQGKRAGKRQAAPVSSSPRMATSACGCDEAADPEDAASFPAQAAAASEAATQPPHVDRASRDLASIDGNADVAAADAAQPVAAPPDASVPTTSSKIAGRGRAAPSSNGPEREGSRSLRERFVRLVRATALPPDAADIATMLLLARAAAEWKLRSGYALPSFPPRGVLILIVATLSTCLSRRMARCRNGDDRLQEPEAWRFARSAANGFRMIQPLRAPSTPASPGAPCGRVLGRAGDPRRTTALCAISFGGWRAVAPIWPSPNAVLAGPVVPPSAHRRGLRGSSFSSPATHLDLWCVDSAPGTSDSGFGATEFLQARRAPARRIDVPGTFLTST